MIRSTHDHEDHVSYWLIEATSRCLLTSEKVFMVMSRTKSEVYYCFMMLSGFFSPQVLICFIFCLKNTCQVAGLPGVGIFPFHSFRGGRFYTLQFCYIFSSFRSINNNKNVDKVPVIIFCNNLKASSVIFLPIS